jgi:hypothetical protein
MKINVRKLSKHQLKALLRLRLRNLGCEGFNKITIEEDTVSTNGFCGIVSHRKWADFRQGMIVDKLYINEFEYLLSQNILSYSHVDHSGGKSSHSIIEVEEDYL